MPVSASSMASSATDKLSNCDAQKGSGNNYGSISNSWWGLPSQSSTDAATKDRMYGNNNGTGNGDYSYQAVQTSGSALELSKMEETLKNKSHKRRKIQVGLFVAIVILIAAPAYYLAPWSTKSDTGGDEYNVARTSSVPFPFSPKNSKRPLSTLHPVHDLGLNFFARPEGTRPSPALFSKAATASTRRLAHKSSKHHAHAHESDIQEDEDDSAIGSETPPQSAFPTNAWYQNMLLVPHVNDTGAEPTAVHRAYAAPFIVDAVGPIPGLRVHPNHVDASTAVVQVNTVDKYGLTVGAGPSSKAKTTNTKEIYRHSDKEKESMTEASNIENDTTPAVNMTHVYSVEKMTPLGLTLGWVSRWVFFGRSFYWI